MTTSRADNALGDAGAVKQPRSKLLPILTLFAVLVAGIVTVGVAIVRSRAPAYPPYVRGRCYTPPGGKPIRKPEVPYLYEASAARKESILSGLAQLKVGMGRETVRQIMGDPDVDKPATRITSFHPNGEYIGVFWDYIIMSADEDGTNINDVVIGLTFDPNDHLRTITDTRKRAPR